MLLDELCIFFANGVDFFKFVYKVLIDSLLLNLSFTHRFSLLLFTFISIIKKILVRRAWVVISYACLFACNQTLFWYCLLDKCLLVECLGSLGLRSRYLLNWLLGHCFSLNFTIFLLVFRGKGSHRRIVRATTLHLGGTALIVIEYRCEICLRWHNFKTRCWHVCDYVLSGNRIGTKSLQPSQHF